MVVAGREKDRLCVSLGDVEPEHVAVEGEGARQVGDPKVHVTDIGARADLA